MIHVLSLVETTPVRIPVSLDVKDLVTVTVKEHVLLHLQEHQTELLMILAK